MGKIITVSSIYTDNIPVSYVIREMVNELAEFTFSIHYKLGKQYVIADTLSPTPENMHTDVMKLCIATLPPDQVKAILDGAETEHQSIQLWTASLNTVMVQKHQKILIKLIRSDKCFNICFKEEQGTTRRTLDLKNQNHHKGKYLTEKEN